MQGTKLHILLDTLSFEIRYAYGYTYLDRAGQTVVDVERRLDGWIPAQITPNNGLLSHPVNNWTANFDPSHYGFTALLLKRTTEVDIETIASETKRVWEIIRANLGLSEYVRIGLRAQLLLPTLSTSDSEARISRSDLNISVPKAMDERGYKTKYRTFVAVFERDGVDCRVGIQGVARTEARAPDPILQQKPAVLSKNQRQVRLQIEQERTQYSVNPMYGVSMDVDISQGDPETVNPVEFIQSGWTSIATDFLPMLERIAQ